MINLRRHNPAPDRHTDWFATAWCAACLIISFPAHAIAEGAAASEYAVKAAIVFKIAKFVSWPEQAFSDVDDPLSVCVREDNPITEAMSALSGKSIHGRSLSVQYLDDSTTVPGDCQILFLTTGPGDRQLALLDAASGQPVLTIGDNDQFISRGGIIGLEVRQDRVHFAINVAASQNAGLDISAQLLQLAKVTNDHKGP